MPASGAVYQPTTVTYEQQPSESRWHSPIAYISQWFSNGINRTRFLLWGTFVLGLCVVAGGLQVLINGALGTYPTFLVVGIILILLGAAIIALFVHMALRRRMAWTSCKGAGGAEAGGPGSGALGAPNPSTDPLVAAQYAPVRDAPPADDERRQLMDNKDCLSSAEESDRMLESDPRIVLRPLKNVEEA